MRPNWPPLLPRRPERRARRRRARSPGRQPHGLVGPVAGGPPVASAAPGRRAVREGRRPDPTIRRLQLHHPRRRIASGPSGPEGTAGRPDQPGRRAGQGQMPEVRAALLGLAPQPVEGGCGHQVAGPVVEQLARAAPRVRCRPATRRRRCRRRPARGCRSPASRPRGRRAPRRSAPPRRGPDGRPSATAHPARAGPGRPDR